MAKASFRERVPVVTGSATHPAAGMAAKVWNNRDNELGTRLDNGFDAKPLQLKSLADKLFDKHGFLLQIVWLVALP
jgi:hypothetical protein